MTEVKMIRQGDVLLRRLDALPEDAVRFPLEGPFVLAHGEETGHAHVLQDSEAVLYRLQPHGQRYVVLERAASLFHEEHPPVTVEPGVWEILTQREYVPERPGHTVDVRD